LVLKNRAIHCRSNLLSRSRGISITSTPGSWPSPGLQGLNARGALKVPRRMLAAPRRGCSARGAGGAKTASSKARAVSCSGEPFQRGARIRSKISTGHYCPDGHLLAFALCLKNKNSAWAADLLVNNQRLRQSKPFRAARKRLEITATREGLDRCSLLLEPARRHVRPKSP
jgi:hypothetical protein